MLFMHDVSKQRGSVISISILEDEATMMFRNVGHQSPSDAASHARITETPIEPQQKTYKLANLCLSRSRSSVFRAASSQSHC